MGNGVVRIHNSKLGHMAKSNFKKKCEFLSVLSLPRMMFTVKKKKLALSEKWYEVSNFLKIFLMFFDRYFKHVSKLKLRLFEIP